MIEFVRTWLQERRLRLGALAEEKHWKNTAVGRAVAEFEKKHGCKSMGASVLRLGREEAVVRVLYLSNRIPPDRAWYAVARSDFAVRQMSFDDVADLETTPWR